MLGGRDTRKEVSIAGKAYKVFCGKRMYHSAFDEDHLLVFTKITTPPDLRLPSPVPFNCQNVSTSVLSDIGATMSFSTTRPPSVSRISAQLATTWYLGLLALNTKPVLRSAKEALSENDQRQKGPVACIQLVASLLIFVPILSKDRHLSLS